jgi:cytosolic 5'-nucleotidase 3
MNIKIPHQEEFEKKKDIFKNEGIEKIHIISDFDRTLTKAFVNGEKFPSIISQLYDGHHLTDDYTQKANALKDKYHPIEINSNIPIEEKRRAMEEWWRTHKKLLIESGLNLKDVQDIVDNGKLEFRVGATEFFDLANNNNIPLVIFSSSGIGEAIPMYFKKINRNYKNIHIVTNSMIYNENGNAIATKEPVIHVFNKGEIALKGLPIMKKLKVRKNVLLLGDSLGDLDMIEGFKYDNIIKIGFYNYKEENLEDFEKNFDAIILNDGSMNFVNDLLKEIIKK